MDAKQQESARHCLEGAEDDTMTFPQIVGTLMEAGFEGYFVDLRLGRATYYLPNGGAVEFPTHRSAVAISPSLDTEMIQGAIREAQELVSGYTYNGFCDKMKRAGCAGYMVSFSGRRALYFGRTAETYVEHFPQ